MFEKQFDGFEIIAGPCAVESETQIEAAAQLNKSLGIKYIRGGAYKPRTSPEAFQGLGRLGIKLLAAAARHYGLKTVSEVLDVREIDFAAEYIDVIQVGSRNMQNFPLLTELGKLKKPVLLKRGFMSTAEEFLSSASYVLKGGNRAVILCERGIRSFDPRFRAVIDFGAVALLKKETNATVIVDASHSLTDTALVIPIARAVKAVGADGLMTEVHPDPAGALSDKNTQLDFDTFKRLIAELA